MLSPLSDRKVILLSPVVANNTPLLLSQHCLLLLTRRQYSQLQDEDHLVLVLKGIMQVDQLGVVQVVHDVDLVLHRVLVQRVGSVDELGHKHSPRRLLYAAVDHTECTAGQEGWSELVVPLAGQEGWSGLVVPLAGQEGWCGLVVPLAGQEGWCGLVVPLAGQEGWCGLVVPLAGQEGWCGLVVPLAGQEGWCGLVVPLAGQEGWCGLVMPLAGPEGYRTVYIASGCLGTNMLALLIR